MSSPLSKPSEFTGGAWFKPAEHTADVAILFEPKRVDRDQPSQYGVRDVAVGDITVFATEESLDKGEPTEVLKGGKVDKGLIISSLEKVLGGAMGGIVRKITLNNGNTGWVLRDLDAKTEGKVVAYLEKRDKEIQDNLDSAPDFED